MALKLCYLDLETSPVLGYAYQKYEATVIGVKEESFLLSFSFKWEGEKKVRSYSLLDFNAKGHDDTMLATMLWQVMDKADIIVAHNGDKFDIKKSNTYFIRHGLKPPSPFRSIDTLKIARRYFSFFGNSLDDLARFFNIGGKKEVEKELWRRCLERDRKAFKKLVEYNKHDVVLLEKIYKILLPWIQNHPHINPEAGEYVCPNCGGRKIYRRGFYRNTKTTKIKLQCQNCGHWFLGKDD